MGKKSLHLKKTKNKSKRHPYVRMPFWFIGKRKRSFETLQVESAHKNETNELFARKMKG